MERQKAEARKSLDGLGRGGDRDRLVRDRATSVGATEFLGYDTETAEGVVTALVVDGKEVGRRRAPATRARSSSTRRRSTANPAARSATAGVIARRGRDVPRRRHAEEARRRLFVHRGKVVEGALKQRRRRSSSTSTTRAARAIRANHSATHLLHEALREMLGTHVAQKGSLVAPDRLRFDFSHPKPMSRRELAEVEAHRQRASSCRTRRSTTRLMTVDDAIADGRHGAVRREIRRRGARRLDGRRRGGREGRPHLFGRAVRRHACARAPATSASSTIVAESAVGAGVRRIEALTGDGARAYLDRAGRARAAHGRGAESPRPTEVVERLEALVEERSAARARARRGARSWRWAAAAVAPAAARPGRSRASSLLGRVLQGVGAKDLRGLVDEGKSRSRLRHRRHRRRHRGQGRARRRRHRRPRRAVRRGSIWCASAPRRSAARAAAAGPTWRRPAAPRPTRPMPRWQRSRRRWQPEERGGHTSIALPFAALRSQTLMLSLSKHEGRHRGEAACRSPRPSTGSG